MDRIFGWKKQQNQTLEIVNTNLELLLASSLQPNWDHNNFTFYRVCDDENIKMSYRLKFDKIRNLMKKEIDIGALIKETKLDQFMLSSKMGNSNYEFDRTDNEKAINELFRKVGNVLKENQQKEFRETGVALEMERIAMECNRTLVKHNILWKAIRSYRKEDQRPFTDFIGENGLKQFQNTQIAELYQFNENLKKKKTGMGEKLKNIVSSGSSTDREILLIENTLNKMENIQNIYELQKFLYQTKLQSQHQKIFLSFVGNAKRSAKLAIVIDSFKTGLSSNKEILKNILSQIDCDCELDKKTKINLLEIGNKVMEVCKISQVFQDIGIKLDYNTVRQLFDYLTRLSKLVGMQVQELEQKYYNNNSPSKKKAYFSEILHQKHVNIFNLLPNFSKMVQLLNSPTRPQLGMNLQTNYLLKQQEQKKQELEAKSQVCRTLKQENKRYEQQIKLLKMRIFNLNTKISKYESQDFNISDMEPSEVIQRISEQNFMRQSMTQNQRQSKEINQAPNLSQEIQNLKQKLQDTKNELNRVQQKLEASIKVQEQIKKDLKCETDLSTELKEKVHQFQLKNDGLLDEIDQLKFQLQKKNKQLSQVQNKFQLLLGQKKKQLNVSSEKFEQLAKQQQQQRIKDQQKQKQKNKNQELPIDQLAPFTFFCGTVFNNFRDLKKQGLKKTLIENIEKETQKAIENTKLIYRLDLLNIVSPHKYIDGIFNWLAIFQLKNGQIVGVYCQDPIERGRKARSGFIFNLNSNKIFRLLGKNEKAKIYQYEQYFLLIGNSQMRYRFGGTVLQSSFGCNFKYFDSGKSTLEDFFGQNRQQYELEAFDFYQITFMGKN